MLCNCESHFPIKITTAGAFARTHLHLSFKMRIEVTALTVRQFSEKLTFYQDHMERCLLPFWEKALDHENGAKISLHGRKVDFCGCGRGLLRCFRPGC